MEYLGSNQSVLTLEFNLIFLLLKFDLMKEPLSSEYNLLQDD
jgi:hypothetical protein